MMGLVREKPTQSIVDVERSACAAGIFVTHALDDQKANDVIAIDRCR
jgi:hypothetical protein